MEKLESNGETTANVDEIAATEVAPEHVSYADVTSPFVDINAVATENSESDSSYADIVSPPASSSELLASELAAFKLADSRENLVVKEPVVEPLSDDADKSTGGLNKLTRTGSKLGLNSQEAKKSTEELVAVALDEPKAAEGTESNEENENVKEETEDIAGVVAESEPAVTEETKKNSCLAEKSAKCRCIIS